jgi:glycogen debranching enzyme
MTRDALIDGYTVFVSDPARTGSGDDDDGGLFHRDTRHLSELSVAIEDAQLTSLGRDLTAPNRRTVLATDENRGINRVDKIEQKRSDLVVETTQAVGADAGLVQRIGVVNHSTNPFSTRMTVAYGADFADVFEVRGFASRLGRDPAAVVDGRTVTFRYEHETADAERLTRSTTVAFDTDPARITTSEASFDLNLGPQERVDIGLQVRPQIATTPRQAGNSGVLDAVGFDPADVAGTDPVAIPTIQTGRADYDRLFARAGEDLAALAVDTEHGPVPLAGAPWFATVFGRDSLIAGYQTLPVAPDLAAGTLRYLATHQGTKVDGTREEAPGKMFHEMRSGELARRGRVPHSPYYGSIDATPLWIVVLAEYHRWTGDDDIVKELAGALEAALSWIDRTRSDHGDDLFLYYEQSPTMGLLHKAWRDTPGSVQYPDGTVASPPIASVEVQGYVYRALRGAAELYEDVLDAPGHARDLRAEADRLAEAFNETFWLPDTGFYAAAKDGDGATVPTPTSNVGHCLWSDIVPDARAPAVVETLRSEDLFSGWGLRTVGQSAGGYSPVSYHLGGVWPHDTSLTALGFARYGFHDPADRLTGSLLDACSHFEQNRIPELFCGFGPESTPKPYASSCVPQAWSAGAPYALLRAAFAVDPVDAGIEAAHDPSVLAGSALDPLMDRWSE